MIPIYNFQITAESRQSGARLGILKTPHGEIKTPAFVAVGTKGTVKSLSPEDLDSVGAQFVFVNTYHLVLSPGLDVLEKAGGIHRFSKIEKPIISDSGGFQVFSLARKKLPPGVNGRSATYTEPSPTLVKITDDGVVFHSHIDGKKFFFTPEFSIKAQGQIGADLIVAFDECLPAGPSHAQTARSIRRTFDWAKRSLMAIKSSQKMYGVIQGGQYQDLRKQSAQEIISLPFFGIGIGGVAVGETKKEMRQQCRAVMKIIANDPRPRHLFGVGEADDIIDMVKMGVDTFDCVLPTRMARTGTLILGAGNFRKRRLVKMDIFKSDYKNDLSPIDKNCLCGTCQNFSRSYLHHLFKQRELLGYHLATIHNLFSMESFFTRIRHLIAEGSF